SSPEFNPNVYSKRFTPDTWKLISSNPFKTEINRAIQGLYSPGSVFKATMAVAGLAEGAVGPGATFDCTGSAVFFGRRFRDWRRQGHGVVAVTTALKVSCDIFFYNVGARLGVDKISEWAHNLGLGEISKIDLDGEKAGIVPSTDWAAKKQHRKWYPSETISVAIGQGPLIITPLQSAVMMASVANGGTVYRPHVVRMIERSGWFSTAGLPFMQRDHAWFVSYATKENPQMVVSVFVEHAGQHGVTDAAPLAKMLYESRFKEQIESA